MHIHIEVIQNTFRILGTVVKEVTANNNEIVQFETCKKRKV